MTKLKAGQPAEPSRSVPEPDIRPAATCAIAVMAKAPRAGRSKTRLCPPLDPEQAAHLSRAFHHDMFANIAAAARQAPITGYAAYAPAGAEDLIAALGAPGMALLLADGTAPMPPDVLGFGRCLLHAMQGMFTRGHAAACVLNSDSPTLPTACLSRAAEALLTDGERVVLGPAEDGGYYLLGLRRAHAHMFADIAWSTNTVAATTRLRAAELGLGVVELPTWYDVDDDASLQRLLRAIDDDGAFAAPATRAALRDLGLVPFAAAVAE